MGMWWRRGLWVVGQMGLWWRRELWISSGYKQCDGGNVGCGSDGAVMETGAVGFWWL